ncbi:MAG: hypothetical protein AAGA62_13715 [Bacteroidota bacterium]
MGGGQSTTAGERYRYRSTDFRDLSGNLLFNVNYDRNTYSPDPSEVHRPIYLFFGISQRL